MASEDRIEYARALSRLIEACAGALPGSTAVDAAARDAENRSRRQALALEIDGDTLRVDGDAPIPFETMGTEALVATLLAHDVGRLSIRQLTPARELIEVARLMIAAPVDALHGRAIEQAAAHLGLWNVEFVGVASLDAEPVTASLPPDLVASLRDDAEYAVAEAALARLATRGEQAIEQGDARTVAAVLVAMDSFERSSRHDDLRHTSALAMKRLISPMALRLTAQLLPSARRRESIVAVMSRSEDVGAEALFAHPEIDFEVDMIDRLPTPFGLVRAGVAPDHPKIKNVIRRYEKTAGHEAYRFFGNVTIGADLSAAELAELYDAVIWAYGAGADRKLGIPGEELPGSHAATEFVAWYNGHPDYADHDFDLGCERVVVIGNGNVAADVARMLVLPRQELECTDTAEHSIDVLADSAVRDVLVIGRRGPAQAAFTNPEVRELGELTQADIVIDLAQVELDEASAAFLESDAADATNRKNMDSFTEFAGREPAGKPKRVELRFFRSPVEILGDEKVEGMVLGINELYLDEGGNVRARDTGERETVECGLVLRSIGYLGTPIEGIPHDSQRGVIPNERGRVTGEDGSQVPGHYVVGWIKRGPSGVIGTNKKDATETVEALFEDAAEGRLPRRAADRDALPALLAERGIEFVEYDGWQAIDALETGRGEPLGRPRVKLVRVHEMVDAAKSNGGGGD